MKTRTITLLAALLVPLLAVSASPAQDAAVQDAKAANRIEALRHAMRRFGTAQPPEKPEGTFRLTTYNVENLFDDVDDPDLSGDNEDIDDEKPEHELRAIANAIRAVDADVLCMQEVESESALRWFIDAYIPDMGYEHVVSIDAGNDRGIENAVLSRFPITHSENWPNKELGGVHPELYGTKPNWYAGEPIAFRRSPLRVDVEVPGRDDGSWTLTLFVVHHKSGRFNTYWREAEAEGTMKLIEDVLDDAPERPIVVLGDFNAMNEDMSVQTYLKEGFIDIFETRPSTREIVTHESNRRIDLIVANHNAIRKMRMNNAFVLGTAARPQGVDWRSLSTFEGYASDHYPVSVDVNLYNP